MSLYFVLNWPLANIKKGILSYNIIEVCVFNVLNPPQPYGAQFLPWPAVFSPIVSYIPLEVTE